MDVVENVELRMQICLAQLYSINIHTERHGITLHDYQVEGVEFMLQRELQEDAYGIRGGILADDMGMGKTISILALMIANPCSTLIVVPTADVLEQWRKSILQVLGVDPYVIHPKHLRTSSPEYLESTLDDIDIEDGLTRDQLVVLVSHECFKRDELNRNPETNFLLNSRWGRVVIDEAHVLKNHKSQMFRGAVQLMADVKWAVTGTPVSTKRIPPLMPGGQSHLTNDIRSLVCFLLGDADCYKTVAKDIADDEEARMSLMLRNNTNRRTQRNLDDLQPTKPTIHMKVVDFSTAEAIEYAHLYKKGQLVIDGEEADKGVQILRTLTALRRKCMCESKIQALEEAFTGHRACTRSLVFCHWTDEIEMVKHLLTGLVDRVFVYCGSTKPYEKQDMVTEFQSEDSRNSMVMILQVRAGSVGLNLQKASQVYITSPNWSAAMEMQAISRACRIDTQHPVSVTRFVMGHSIEEFICKRQESKLETASALLKDDRLKTSLTAYDDEEQLSWNDVLMLFGSDYFDTFLPGDESESDNFMQESM
jgi:SNF2 family DNA or RNA helicase